MDKEIMDFMPFSLFLKKNFDTILKHKYILFNSLQLY